MTEHTTQSAKPSKYRNQKTVLDGISFDSKREANYYADLKLRERAGEISNLALKTRYDLIVNGIKICAYVDDFQFLDHTEGRYRVIDVKGVQTPVFKLKKKLMKAVHGIDVEVA